MAPAAPGSARRRIIDADTRLPTEPGDDDRPPGAPAAEAWAALAGTLRSVGRLKRLPRTGWLDRGVPPAETESVADHAFRVALLAWLVAGTGAAEGRPDPARTLLIALAHDLPEAFAGDATPYAPEDIPPVDDPAARRAFLDRRQERPADRAAAKQAAEAAALDRILTGLPATVADPLRAAWREYEAQATPEARLVKQADRLETWLQSREYLATDPDLPMASFALQILDPGTLPDPALGALRDAIAATEPEPAENG